MAVTPFYPPYPQNPMLHANCMAQLFYRTGVIADRSFTLQEYGFVVFASVALTLTR